MVHRVWACQGKTCDGCRDFISHEHPERLASIPSKRFHTVWPCAHGDISFARPEYIKQVIDMTKGRPEQQFYWQTKNPECLQQYLGDFPSNTILLTTLETNRDLDYERISRAPMPSTRYQAFRDLCWPRKIVTIEPIMEFDQESFLEMIHSINPEAVWIGYCSHPNVLLPQPPLEKTRRFIAQLRGRGIEVREKRIDEEARQ
jgi:hypothetical protein